MKKAIRFVLWAVSATIAMAALAVLFFQVRGIPTYTTHPPDLKVEVTPERVQRGKKLAALLCQHCHYNPSTSSYTGRVVADAPPEFGKAYAQNITASKSMGIGSWTDGEIANLLRTGVKRDGKYAPPWMPKLPLMADEDLLSIIAFLRSDDPSVVANDIPDEPCEPSLLTKFLCNTGFKPLPFPTREIRVPDTSDHVAFGRYLAVGVVDCYSCHSADFKKIDPLVPEKSAGFFGGGNAMLDLDGHVIRTANITMDKETGIGNWTKEQFITALMTGQRPDGIMLRAPMAPYVAFDTAEAGAIYEYLQTIPAISNQVAILK